MRLAILPNHRAAASAFTVPPGAQRATTFRASQTTRLIPAYTKHAKLDRHTIAVLQAATQIEARNAVFETAAKPQPCRCGTLHLPTRKLFEGV